MIKHWFFLFFSWIVKNKCLFILHPLFSFWSWSYFTCYFPVQRNHLSASVRTPGVPAETLCPHRSAAPCLVFLIWAADMSSEEVKVCWLIIYRDRGQPDSPSLRPAVWNLAASEIRMSFHWIYFANTTLNEVQCLPAVDPQLITRTTFWDF